VAAELLSMAVAPEASGSGLGLRLVGRLLEWAEDERVQAMKVVVGGDNASAISLYEKAGFVDPRGYEVHRGVDSVVMTWRA
jgi:ribosomal-protein-alanine N-acetyltransferase